MSATISVECHNGMCSLCDHCACDCHDLDDEVLDAADDGDYDFEDEHIDCGLESDGFCSRIGSEECDECPCNPDNDEKFEEWE